MKEFKEKLKVQNTITLFCCIVLFLFTVIVILAEAGVFPVLVPLTGDTHWHSRWRGFITGASTGILALMVLKLIRSIKALKDEAKLKKMYIEVTDERQIQIWTAARAESMRAFVLLGLVAGIVAGYFSVTVSVTIIACVTIHSLMGFGFKLYYSSKF